MVQTVPHHPQNRITRIARESGCLRHVAGLDRSENLFDPFRIPAEPPARPPEDSFDDHGQSDDRDDQNWPHHGAALIKFVDEVIPGDMRFVQVRCCSRRSAGGRRQGRGNTGSGSSWRGSWCTRRRLTRSGRRHLCPRLRRCGSRRLCRSSRLLDRSGRSWWRILRRRRWLLGRSLRGLGKRTQRDQTKTESKQYFHNFGGVEFKTARHISFIPKRLDTSRAKVFTFLQGGLVAETSILLRT